MLLLSGLIMACGLVKIGWHFKKMHIDEITETYFKILQQIQSTFHLSWPGWNTDTDDCFSVKFTLLWFHRNVGTAAGK